MIDVNFKLQDNSAINKILINISIPEKCIERNIEWNLNDTVESLKYYILKLLPDLEDPLNYGFFLPACNGKNGKFLQEERLLNHYLVEAPYKVELRKKVRLHYSNSPKLKKINNKMNQKQFLLCIKHAELMKINKLLSNGLDPNFHVQGQPETPLTLACRLEDPHKIIMALVSNGAYFDFRASDSMTALHKVAKEGLYEPMKTLLQLGQSPNCKDNKGFTPLYYCIENDAPADCVNILLFEHSIMGIRDEQGFQEIHKACLFGRTVHLDHLLSYGADIDAKTTKGNTALHICALHNQGSCARLLLYRGITRYVLDNDNKSAYQTALLSNNLEIADLIQNFRDEDVVPVTCLPKFNDKRRSIVPLLKRFSSTGILNDNIEEKCSNFTEIGNQTSEVDCDVFGNNSILGKSPPNTQSLKMFANPVKANVTQLNTWSSPAYNIKSNPKARIPIASIMSSKLENMPRTVVLQRGSHGFGFLIRGIKNESETHNRPNNCSTQYFECVAENSPAYKAGLLSGDYLLEVNNIDVHEMVHDNVVKIIKMAGDCLTLKVITINPNTMATGLFDTNSETRSSSGSQSIVSDNSISTRSRHSENMADVNEQLRIVNINNNNTLKTEPSNIAIIPPLVPPETQESYFIKSKFKKNMNTPESTTSAVLKKMKIHAPPLPVRNDNTSLTVCSNGKDPAMKSLEDKDKKINFPILATVKVTSSIQTPDRDYSSMEPVTISKIAHYIPPPDYISDTDVDTQSSKLDVVDFKTIPGSNMGSSAGTFVPLPPPPSIASVPAPPAPPPPPPPPPPPADFGNVSRHLINNSNNLDVVPIIRVPLNLDKEISNVSLKHVSANTDSISPNETNPNDHSEALKFAVLNYRRKIESGDSQPAQIEEKLKEIKVGNKSMIFQASTVLSPNLENDKQPPVNANSTAKNHDYTQANICKNPPTYPKPGTHVFTPGTKPVVNMSPKTESEKPNQNNNETNLRLKAENLRSGLLKKEQETKKGTLYFSNAK